jgi:hypothetical protein
MDTKLFCHPEWIQSFFLSFGMDTKLFCHPEGIQNFFVIRNGNKVFLSSGMDTKFFCHPDRIQILFCHPESALQADLPTNTMAPKNISNRDELVILTYLSLYFFSFQPKI